MIRGTEEFLTHKALQWFSFCVFNCADKPIDQQLLSLEMNEEFSIIRIKGKMSKLQGQNVLTRPEKTVQEKDIPLFDKTNWCVHFIEQKYHKHIKQQKTS